MRWRIAAALAIVMLISACSSSDNSNSSNEAAAKPNDSGLPVLTFTSSGGANASLAVEVANDTNEMTCGLMHRTELPDDQGMIFVYAEDANGGFWMRNTLLPLSIAYTAADGRIVDILDMAPVPAPGNTPFRLPDGSIVPVGDGQQPPPGAVWATYPPRQSYRYAIEVNQGWFARNNIAIGDHVDVSAALANPDAATPPPICVERGT
ncbi:MAG: DUF192 domain-containing protein [Dehalococcoidia bacterium]